MKPIEFSLRARWAFETGGRTDVLVEEFSSMSDPDKIVAWTVMTERGVDDIPFAKFAHSLFGAIVFNVFKDGDVVREPSWMTPEWSAEWRAKRLLGEEKAAQAPVQDEQKP